MHCTWPLYQISTFISSSFPSIRKLIILTKSNSCKLNLLNPLLWVKFHCINKFSDVRFECIERKINPRETINPINLILEPNTRLNKKFILSGLEIIIIIITEPHVISVAVPQGFSESRIVRYKTSSSNPTFVVPVRELALSRLQTAREPEA